MTLQDILQEAKTLSLAERRELIKLLVDTLTDGAPVERVPTAQPRHLHELAGLGADIWEGIDPQQYVNDLRGDWDHHP